MALRTSTQLEINTVYTRDQLREKFDITDATINNGIFRPKNTDSVWLFLTKDKTRDRVQYQDTLDDDTVVMQGQTEGRTDHLIKDQASNGLELIVFYRSKKYEYEGAGFRNLGLFHYIRSFGSRPTSFVLQRDTGRDYANGKKQGWHLVLEALQKLGGRATKSEIESTILENIPEFKVTNIGPDLSLLTVNDNGRSNFPQNAKSRRSDSGSVYDAIYRKKTDDGPFFELYEPAKHGVWELMEDVEGKLRPVKVSDDIEWNRAEQIAQDTKLFDANDDTEAREKTQATITLRRGQPKFRRQLLVAYSGRCAITGCDVKDVLEAAHIKPHLGEHTDVVTNGLLLRADIHTLFDLHLIRINPLNLMVEVAPEVISGYGDYDGTPLLVPAWAQMRPDGEALSRHFKDCQKNF